MKFAGIVLFSILQFGICLFKEGEESPPRVLTPLGAIEGYYKKSNNGRRFEAYEGIPFAQPPTGEFRFQTARRVSPWQKVLMAKQSGSSCMQYDATPAKKRPERLIGSEDCLYLNIYTPISHGAGYDRREVFANPENLLPVVFFIHGGAFQIGAGNESGPSHLMDKHVIFVSSNYRLGPLGFLSTEDDIVPGNAGLKDQVMAMRFVKENIKAFGGNPSKITIFGQSAGASSVHFHYLSPLTKGLFNGGMSLSGTALDCWALIKNPLAQAKKLAKIVGCSTDDIKGMVNCLRYRPAEQIVNAIEAFIKWPFNPPVPFAPSIEKGGTEFTFIDRQPIDIIASGNAHDVPWVSGVVSEEGLVPAAFLIPFKDQLVDLDKRWETEAADLLRFEETIPKSDQPRVARLIKQHYLGNRSIDWRTFNETVQIIGDRLFVYDCEKAARVQARAKRGSVYVYYFSYRGTHSNTDKFSAGENYGVSHGDDLRYVLDPTFDTSTSTRDQKMQELLTNLWVSFAMTGKPDVGVEWPKVDSWLEEEYRYMHIAGPDKISMKSSSNFGKKKFWHSLGFQENIQTVRI